MIKIFSLLKGAIVVIFVSFGKVQTAIFFDKINFENFLLIKVYIQNIKNWERASNIQELWVCLMDTHRRKWIDSQTKDSENGPR